MRLQDLRDDLEGSESIAEGEWGYYASLVGRRITGLWRKDGSLSVRAADRLAALGTCSTIDEREAWLRSVLFGEGT